MRNLDPIDRHILENLQRDGRMTMTDLATRVGLSATPCTERVRRMEREEIISGYHAHINPHALGLKLLVFVEIRLRSKSGDALDKAKQKLQLLPEIMECHMVSGDFDYLVKARLAEMSDYRKLLSHILLQLPPASESSSYIVMEELKETLHLQL
ncbi:AsnC family transcriptional regulator [Zoogloea oleivorans]|jgi:Lrp/AsnC family leucine-responsive transcriptional regulator|uniref:AsnC family transcriptional regulator n=1 Tax=Zoogloea oleivorans TaxID=1552750 RepID=A0A6C2CR77_9RHOO|nr:Lrp/AsnC ligand binding domain-containing protein [Zoogloea oleivorans]TYC56647.1 AsnC family transcriptional regulator [Zoogloea oleivorans]